MTEMQSAGRKMVVVAVAWALITGLNIVLLPAKYAPHIEAEAIKQMPMPLMVRAAGNLEAKDSNTIKAQFDGPVLTKNFREGQLVRKGQLLAEIGRDHIKVDYQGKKDALVNAEADLKHARRDLRLQKELFRKEAVAYSTVEDAQRTLVKAEQGLRSAQETMKLAQDQWDSSNVMAPLNGTVVKDWIGEDKSVTSGKEILTVADVSEYTVHARVDELDIHQVHEGQKAEVYIQVFGNKALPAVVMEVGSQLEGNGLPEIPIVLRLTGTSDLLLRPKLTAEARISTGETDPIVSVPLSALVNMDGNPNVWIITAVYRLQKRQVGIGRSNPDRIEITHGLAPGEKVCVMAEPDFAEGMHVIIGPPGEAEGRGSRTAKFLPEPRNDAANLKSPGDSTRIHSIF